MKECAVIICIVMDIKNIAYVQIISKYFHTKDSHTLTNLHSVINVPRINWPIWTLNVPKESWRGGLQSFLTVFSKIICFTWTVLVGSRIFVHSIRIEYGRFLFLRVFIFSWPSLNLKPTIFLITIETSSKLPWIQ